MKKNVSALLLCLAMLCSAIPIVPTAEVFAAEETEGLIAADGTLTVTRNELAYGVLLVPDVSNASLTSFTFEIVRQPNAGTITSVDELGKFTYKPNHNRLGEDSFTFKVTDPHGQESNIATISINIEPKVYKPGFDYADLKEHWSNFAAGQIGSMGRIVGERLTGEMYDDLFYFKPNKPLTRGEFVLFICAALEVSWDAEIGKSHFADVNESYLIGPLNAAVKKGIISGTKVGNDWYFYPHRDITRIEAMVMLEKALDLPVMNHDPLTFADSSSVPPWAVESLKTLVGYKVVVGTSDNRVKPLETLTRAEGISLAYKGYLEYLVQESNRAEQAELEQ